MCALHIHAQGYNYLLPETGPLIQRVLKDKDILAFQLWNPDAAVVSFLWSATRWQTEHADLCCFDAGLHFFTLSSLLPTAILWTGELWDFLSFTERYPSVIYNIMLFGVTSALGQVGGRTTGAHDRPAHPTDCFTCGYQTFIFLTVVNFGPLTCSIVTTTRKFFTILGSVLLFGNSMSTLQWTGTILVFLGEPLHTHNCNTDDPAASTPDAIPQMFQ